MESELSFYVADLWREDSQEEMVGSEGCHSWDRRGSVKMHLSWRLASANLTMEPISGRRQA